MGSWGYGPFDDDTALDFVDDLVDRQATYVVPALHAALDRLAAPGGALDYSLSVQGLAAAALLAGCVPYPEDQRNSAWVSTTIPPLDHEIATLACQAIEAAYGEDAILTELAIEAGNLTEHLAGLEPVRQRLRAAIPPPQTETLF